MTNHLDIPGDDAVAPPCRDEEEDDDAMIEAQLRELMPRAVRGDLAAIDGVLDLLARRRRGQEEWMRWLWPPVSSGTRGRR